MIKRTANELHTSESHSCSHAPKKARLLDDSNAKEICIKLNTGCDIVVLSGPPGSGKTTSSRLVLARRPGTVIISRLAELDEVLNNKKTAAGGVIIDVNDEDKAGLIARLDSFPTLSWTTMEFFLVSPRELGAMVKRWKDLNEGIDKITGLLEEVRAH
ncbi:hypothetical protein TrVE_jg5900 [Triparma verrucosa]|uniref:Uncharacterized protein n=1 Tax=Triparma verrucosa TaxID=1606542 RepID=A0A9W7C740_9STRA|nr:hypothetical protein TrVE_jg5900 [Triparma verrucosa]